MQSDREKGLRVLAETPRGGFRETVEHYWRLTPDTPRARAAGFVERVIDAEARSAEWLDHVVAPLPQGASVLDLGCGTGDLAVVLERRGTEVAGIDIAFRWIVQARRREWPASPTTVLVCANAEHLPFADASFDLVLSLYLLEHCRALSPVLVEAARVLRPGGRLVGRTMNRFAPMPEPHVGVWGVGWIPRRWADRYVRWRIGESYQHHRLPSTSELRRALAQSGLAGSVRSATMLSTEMARLSGISKRLAKGFDRLQRVPLLGAVLHHIAPLLEFDVQRPST